MTMNGAVLPCMAFYIVAGEEQGVKHEQLTGTIQNDILKEFMVRNTYIYPPAPSIRIIGDIFAYTSKEMPRFNSISISGYHMQEAGATADIELGYTLADGLEYLRTGVNAGMPVDTFRAALVLLLGHRHELLHGSGEDAGRAPAVGQDRQAVQSQERKVHGPAHPFADLGLESHRAGSLQQRGAHLHRGHGGGPGAYPVAAYQRPGRGHRAAHGFSARIARNTQLYLQDETNICKVVDPWAGSYYVEALTDQLVKKAWQHIQEIEELGGMTKAIDTGLPKMRIEEAAARRQAQIDSGKETIVGLNKYRLEQEDPLEILDIDNSRGA